MPNEVQIGVYRTVSIIYAGRAKTLPYKINQAAR